MERRVHIAAGLMIVTLTFLYWPGIEETAVRERLLIGGGFVYLCLFGMRRWPREVEAAALWGLLVVGFVWARSIILHHTQANIFFICGISSYEYIFGLALLFGVFLKIPPHRREFVDSCIRVSAVLLCAHVGMQAQGLFFPFAKTRYGLAMSSLWDFQLGGFMLHQNYLAAYLAVTLPLFFKRPWCWFLLLIVPMLVAQVTATAIAAAGVALIVYFYKRDPHGWRWVQALALTVFLGALYIAKLDSVASNLPRLAVWKKVLWPLVIKSPSVPYDVIPPYAIIGAGPGSTELYVRGIRHITTDQIQSDLVINFFELGWGGMILMACMAVKALAQVLSLRPAHAAYGAALVAFGAEVVGSMPIRAIPGLAVIGAYVYSVVELESRPQGGASWR